MLDLKRLRMFQLLISLIFALFLVASNTFGSDRVTTWLNQMGCEELLTIYLEEQLESGTNQERITAATELAELYALILAKSSDGSENQILQKANSLLESMPQAGTDDLRLQLVRASYLASELLIEKYRLRYVDRTKADIAIEQFQLTVSKLKQIRNKYLNRAKTSKNFKTEDSNRLGLATSLLGWANYYIAWYTKDPTLAEETANIFATMIDSENASIQEVSLDFRSEEYGARALLGIALCKDLTNLPNSAEVWLETLDHEETWGDVRRLLPMWRFILDIDHHKWSKVLYTLQTDSAMMLPHTLRLAAVHAIETNNDQTANKVAALAIQLLIDQAELGVVSEIIDQYGDGALSENKFIAKYLKADLQYRTLREKYPDSEPSDNAEVKGQFNQISTLLEEALNSVKPQQDHAIRDECLYLYGLTKFYSGQFVSASNTFQELGNRISSERALWMSIVSLDHVTPSNEMTDKLKSNLIKHYIALWPNSHKSTQLKLQLPSVNYDQSSIEDLLAVQSSDPNFNNAQRQAARMLYEEWSDAEKGDFADIGNRYVGVVIPIMFIDAEQHDDPEALNRAAVRSLRILEVSLHQEVLRLTAAQRAFDTLNALGDQIDLSKYHTEIMYRDIFRSTLTNSPDSILLVQTMIEQHPNDPWTNHACIAIWNSWADNNHFEDQSTYFVGSFILQNLSESQIASPRYIGISTATVQAGLNIYNTTKNAEISNDVLRLSRSLLKSYPNSKELLQISAKIEEELGDHQLAKKHWKTISAGSTKGGNDWIEAKYRYISLVADDDPVTALSMLDQHVALYPSYGKQPFASLLEELHLTLQGGSHGS